MLVEKYVYKTNTTTEYAPSELVMAIPPSDSVPSTLTATKDRWELHAGRAGKSDCVKRRESHCTR